MKKNIATNNRKMKTLKQIQSENREAVIMAVIMANNPEAKSYEEALEMELGKPLTLSKILIGTGALSKDDLYMTGTIDSIIFSDNIDCDSTFGAMLNNIFEWDLTKETLEEQSEETQREINKLLN